MPKQLQKSDPRDIQIAGLTLTATGISGELLEPPAIEEFRRAMSFVSHVGGATNWWKGDLANYADSWGDEYVQLLEELEVDQATLEKYRYVAKSVSHRIRIPELSWSHHRVVSGLSDTEQKKLLAKAQPPEGSRVPRLSVSELKEIVRERKLAAEREKNPLPDGTYRVLYADPPWHYNDERTGTEASGSASSQYSTLKTDEICELADANGRAVKKISQPDAVLFLWATSPLLPDALRVMEAWGFAYKASFVWDKVRSYNGHYNDVRHELLLLGTRGSCTPDKKQLDDSVIAIERTAHSKKPHEFYELIEGMYSNGPYVELFARNRRDGWESWGNQA